MAGVAQAMATAQAGSTAHMDTFTGVMEGLKIMCDIMTKGFQHACLDVEYIVCKTMEEATAHDQAFTQVAAADLDLWTAVLRVMLESTGVSADEMEER